MSANNWTTCPRCNKDAEAEQAKKAAKAAAAYGTKSEGEYRFLLEEASAPLDLLDTLREDYQLGVDDEGTFEVTYSCSCRTCGFGFEYAHKQDVPIAKARGGGGR